MIQIISFERVSEWEIELFGIAIDHAKEMLVTEGQVTPSTAEALMLIIHAWTQGRLNARR